MVRMGDGQGMGVVRNDVVNDAGGQDIGLIREGWLRITTLLLLIGSLSHQARYLHHQAHERELTPQVEATCACLRLSNLLAVCLDHRELSGFGHLAKSCLVIEFRKRPTPEELLNDDLFVS